MARRHFFDKGYPVTSATLCAGSEVLLALSHRSLELSRQRIAISRTRLADTSERMLEALIRRNRSDLDLRESRRQPHLSQSGDRVVAFAAGHQRRS